MNRIVHRIFHTNPVLHHEFSGIGFGPCNADAVDGLCLRQVNDYPLRMQSIAFPGKALREIGIALPIAALIAIRHAREASVGSAIVTRKAAMWQRISIGITDGITRDCRSSEISLFARLTPCALRIPVPGLNGEFGILAVRDGLPAGSQSTAQIRLDQVVVDGFCRNAIDSGAERFVWAKAIRGVFRSDIDVDGLGGGENAEKKCEK